jgi:hypothetical protein
MSVRVNKNLNSEEIMERYIGVNKKLKRKNWLK